MNRAAFLECKQRGDALRNAGLLGPAASAYREALAIEPDDPEARYYLGILLVRAGNLHEALESFEELRRRHPTNSQALNSLGALWNDLGAPDRGAAACRAAIENSPRMAEAFSNLGQALEGLGEIEAAVEAYQTAVRLKPSDSQIASNLLYAMNFHPGFSREVIWQVHRAWAQRFADGMLPLSPRPTNDRTVGRRLKLGYVSAHFRRHAVNCFFEPLLSAHNHQDFEITCYANMPAAMHDESTARLQLFADHWCDISNLSDDQAASLIREDKIDILVDLAGHIQGNRLGVFARKPAPVQVSYIGYQNTTGMLAMDYRLTDAWVDSLAESQPYYTERLVRLKQPFFCYRPMSETPEVTPLPTDKAGQVTFGSFNNMAKINRGVWDAWGQILKALPESRLIVLCGAPQATRDYAAAALATHASVLERITFEPKRSPEEFYRLVSQVDIALDPFPFNGHTTTCDALWMGVPVVALAGNTYASRFGTAAHAVLSLVQLVAHSPAQYVSIAVELADDLQRLKHWRQSLRGAMMASPICDPQGFTNRLETIYRVMWSRYCAGQQPQSI